MEGDFAARALAEALLASRVRARRVYWSAWGEARILVMTERPCLPVAPQTMMGLGTVVDMVDARMEVFGGCKGNVERKRRN